MYEMRERWKRKDHNGILVKHRYRSICTHMLHIFKCVRNGETLTVASFLQRTMHKGPCIDKVIGAHLSRINVVTSVV